MSLLKPRFLHGYGIDYGLMFARQAIMIFLLHGSAVINIRGVKADR